MDARDLALLIWAVKSASFANGAPAPKIIMEDILDIIENLGVDTTCTVGAQMILELRLYLSRHKAFILEQSLKDWGENGCVNYDLLNRIDKCDSILRWLHHEKE